MNKGSQKQGKLKHGNTEFVLDPVSAGEIEPNLVYTFAYKAASSGVRGKQMNMKREDIYDSFPLIIVLSMTTKILLGLNVHYLSSVIERGKTILKYRENQQFSKASYDLMIHAYSTARISSSIYLVKQMAVDAKILLSRPAWKTVSR